MVNTMIHAVTLLLPVVRPAVILKSAFIAAMFAATYYLLQHYPKACAGLVSRVSKFAERRWLIIAAVAIFPIVFRLALLQWVPVPVPSEHDEYAHLLLADTLRSGRLSNPTHPFWVHFETVYVLQQPRYASSYPPGQGAVLAVAQWLTGQPWYGVLLSAGLMCGAICWALQGMVGPTWAFIGGLVAIIQFTVLSSRSGPVSYWIDSYWGGAVAAFGGAVLFGALIRLFHKVRVHYSLLISAGWSTIFFTRPYEAMVLGLALACVLSVWLLRSSSTSRAKKLWQVLAPMAAVLAVSLSFALYYNYKVTGDPWLHPYELSKKIYGVPQAFVWQNPVPKPSFQYKSLEDMYDYQLAEYLNAWSLNRVAHRLYNAWGFYFGPLFSIPLLALPWTRITRQAWLLISFTLIGVLGSALYFYYIPHYSAPYAVNAVLVVILGMRALAGWWWRDKPLGACLLVALFTALVVPTFGTIGRFLLDGGMPTRASDRPYVEAQLERTSGRHIVFVHYGAQHKPRNEWVYNSAEIDSSPIVWAREWTPESNEALMRYFSDRFVWTVDADDTGKRPTLRLLRTPFQIAVQQ